MQEAAADTVETIWSDCVVQSFFFTWRSPVGLQRRAFFYLATLHKKGYWTK